jgi:D-serine deaminase-like pyridoxal phosphate-dependent protein
MSILTICRGPRAKGLTDRVTVSTLAEIDYFALAGFRDFTYTIGVAPAKIADIAALQTKYGAAITIVLDTTAAAAAVAQEAARLSTDLSVQIEIDCGGGRSGLDVRREWTRASRWFAPTDRTANVFALRDLTRP